MTRADTVIGAGLAVVFLAFLFAATAHTYQDEFSPGPGFAPFWFGAVGAALSLFVAVRGIRAAPAPTFTRAGVLRAAITVAGLIVALALAETVGFIATMTVYLLVVMLAVERMRPVPALATAVGTMLLVYLVFARFLAVPLPKGPLGF